MVAELAKFRHGLAVIGAADIDGCVAAINKAMGAESITIEGEPTNIHVGGDDSPFAVALKSAAGKSGAVNLILKGPFHAADMKNLNTVLDDNKIYTTPCGTRFPLTTNIRVILFDNFEQWSPASISRVGIVAA